VEGGKVERRRGGSKVEGGWQKVQSFSNFPKVHQPCQILLFFPKSWGREEREKIGGRNRGYGRGENTNMELIPR
jgi:hypothetical protein